jgi:hypothetical protein
MRTAFDSAQRLRRKTPKALTPRLVLLLFLAAASSSTVRGLAIPVTTGSMPLAMLPAPGGEKLIVSLGGWREQGVQVVDLKTRRVEQTRNPEPRHACSSLKHWAVTPARAVR